MLSNTIQGYLSKEARTKSLFTKEKRYHRRYFILNFDDCLLKYSERPNDSKFKIIAFKDILGMKMLDANYS